MTTPAAPAVREGAAVTPSGRPACGARKRQGEGVCRMHAGWGTDHPGEGRCKLHGGATPIRHGRYSRVNRPRVRDLVESFEAEPDPLNTLPEINLLRALAVDYLERSDATNEALIAWHDSNSTKWNEAASSVGALRDAITRGDVTTARAALAALDQTVQQANAGPARPRQVLDRADAYRIVGEVTRAVERHEKARSQNAISRPDLLRILTEMGRVVDILVEDEALKDKIKKGWLAIQLG